MSFEMARRLIDGVWRTILVDEGADGGGGGGGGGGGSSLVTVRFPFTPATDNILVGTVIYTPAVDDTVVWVGIEVVDPWDGSSPIASIFPADANVGSQDLVQASLDSAETPLGAGWSAMNNSSASGFFSTDTTPLLLNVSQGFANITTVDQGTKTFTIDGDQEAFYTLLTGGTIFVAGSSGNDGEYTVASANFDTDHTDIVVVEAIPDATGNGSIAPGGDPGSTSGEAVAILVIVPADS